MKSKVDVRIHFILFSILLTASISAAQEDALQEEEVALRERIIVNVEHLEVASIAQAVTQLSSGDLKVFPEIGANRLIVDGPKADIPAVIGLIRELDRPFPQVVIRVVEVTLDLETKVNLKTGPSEDVKTELDELVKNNKAKITNKMSVETVNNTTARTTVGSTKPSPTGGNGKSKAHTYKDIGTVFECTPRVGADAILLQLSYERSDILSGGDEQKTPPTFMAIRSDSFVRIRRDQSIVVSGRRPGDDGEAKMVAWKLIFSAEVSDD